MSSSTLKIIPRPSHERGNADHGWLKTFHTFDFAMYQGSSHQRFGALRVINEDRVEPKTGFGQHSHREMEIWSYIVSGALQHNDSLHNTEILNRGDIQMTSTGTGISHSEHQHGDKQVHFLQIWAFPDQPRLTPSYYTRHFSDEEKTNKLLKVVAPLGDADVVAEREASGPAPVHSNVTMYASILSPGKRLVQAVAGNGERKVYIHLIQTSGYNPEKSKGNTIKVSDKAGKTTQELQEGDGAYLFLEDGGDIAIENIGEQDAELLFFVL